MNFINPNIFIIINISINIIGILIHIHNNFKIEKIKNEFQSLILFNGLKNIFNVSNKVNNINDNNNNL